MKNTIKFANWLSRWNDWSGILRISVATSLFVIIIVLLLSLKRRKFNFLKNLSKNIIKKRRNKKNDFSHEWHFCDLFLKPTYCNVCEIVMVSGVCCLNCNLYSDEKCLKKADKLFKCKQLCDTHDFIIDNNDEAFRSKNLSEKYLNENSKILRKKWLHHWIKGNLKLNSVCFVCNENDCGNSPSLSDYKCCWCLRTVHESCLNNVSTRELIDICDFGSFKSLILKPNLILNSSKMSVITLKDVKLNLELIEKYDLNEWTPLFIFANLKSGNNDAGVILSHFSTILNPLQVIQLERKNLESSLSWMVDFSDLIQFKILVCGGDGSIGWVLDCLSKLNFKKFEPAVGILPLGTGNDLSRSLKWGEGYIGEIDVEDILHEIDKAVFKKLDRWEIKIEKINLKRNANIENIQQNSNQKDLIQIKYMNNYLSVGCDALVTLNFHRERSSLFFPNRILNKFIYFKYGTIDTFLKECRSLTKNLEIELDGKLIKLPHLESVVVLNIPYWGGGVQPWNLGKGKNLENISKIDDGFLEVFGVYSSFHIAQLQVGIAEPYRIGRAKHVRIKIYKRFPVQVDGEPWEQNPAVINISRYKQVNMLMKRELEFFNE